MNEFYMVFSPKPLAVLQREEFERGYKAGVKAGVKAGIEEGKKIFTGWNENIFIRDGKPVGKKQDNISFYKGFCETKSFRGVLFNSLIGTNVIKDFNTCEEAKAWVEVHAIALEENGAQEKADAVR